MYFIGQLMHFIWYTPFFSYLFVCVYGFIMFCMVLFVLNAIFICVSLKSCVSFLVCFPWYVKVALFLLIVVYLYFLFVSVVLVCCI
jgi:hypothetical protein